MHEHAPYLSTYDVDPRTRPAWHGGKARTPTARVESSDGIACRARYLRAPRIVLVVVAMVVVASWEILEGPVQRAQHDVYDAARTTTGAAGEPRPIVRGCEGNHDALELDECALLECSRVCVPELRDPILGSGRDRPAIKGLHAGQDGRGESPERGDLACALTEVPNRDLPAVTI